MNNRNTIKRLCEGVLLFTFVFSVACKKNPMTPGGSREDPPLSARFGYPAWHPDSRWIAVSHYDSLDTDGDGKRDRSFGGIWLVHSESGEKQPLISGYGSHTWSRDGRKLAMVRNAQIYTIEVASLEPALVDTSSLLQLTTEEQNFYPAWSPDGEWITYDSNSNSPNGMYFLWKMKFDGVQKTRIAYDPLMGEIRQPHWSPDGTSITHIRYVGVNAPEIFVMTSSGGGQTRLTINDTSDLHPKYSPDGTKIAFYSQPRVGPAAAIWVMNSDGSNLRKVSPDYSWIFDWSPDSQRIVFVYLDVLTNRAGNGELWLVNVDGSGLRQLTHSQNSAIQR